MEHSLVNILLFSLAAGLGTLARYLLNSLVQVLFGNNFPWGIFVVNVFGCFGFGLIWSMNEPAFNLHADVKTFLLVGFMGAFTTFSTFIFDSNKLFTAKPKKPFAASALALCNVLGQMLLGLLAFVAAIKIVEF